MIKPPIGPTEPLAGVMEAKPAIQPVTAPTKEDLPNLTFSIMIQTIVAVAADMCVTKIAIPASPFAANALPPLKPNQPTHNIHAPIMVKPGLCGGCTEFGKPSLGPKK